MVKEGQLVKGWMIRQRARALNQLLRARGLNGVTIDKGGAAWVISAEGGSCKAYSDTRTLRGMTLVWRSQPAGDYRFYYSHGAFIFSVAEWAVTLGNPANVRWNGPDSPHAFPVVAHYYTPEDAEAAGQAAGLEVTFTHGGGDIVFENPDIYYDDNQNGSPNPVWCLEKLN